ncbi:cytochrome c oxidase subunit 3 [Stappia albiluteola]|uniref:cytochrome c oxidase subunit 3 n=1 Tax=Stappia albiluteola TaxID=2758565 RepID=UPI002E2D64C4|nr:cytochrome c oxidase subunit 3 [Stappia albiluteola]
MSETAAGAEESWGPLDGLPGNPMMWILILGELAVFGALLTGFSVARALDPSAFAASQGHLHVMLGSVNTLVLLSSGWLAAVALEQVHRGGSGRLALVGAMASGAVFVAVKAIEYADLASAGYGLEGDRFFTLYFLITGFHALHVIMGIAVLGVVAIWNEACNVETGTAFWHMVDLIWLLVFPIVYLVR